MLCGIHEDLNNSEYENGGGSCAVTVELNSGKENYTVIKVTQFEITVCSYPGCQLNALIQ